MAGVAAQRPDELAGGRVALQQAAGDAKQVVVVASISDVLTWWRASRFRGPWSVGLIRQNVAPPASASRGEYW